MTLKKESHRKIKLGEFQLRVGIFFRKEKKQKTTNPQFQIIKKMKNPRIADPVWLGFWVL